MCQQLHSMGFHGWAAPVGVMCRWHSTFVYIVHMILKTTYIRQHYWFLKMWILSIPREPHTIMNAVFTLHLDLKEKSRWSRSSCVLYPQDVVWMISPQSILNEFGLWVNRRHAIFFLSMVEFWTVCVNAAMKCVSDCAFQKKPEPKKPCPLLRCVRFQCAQRP